MQLAEFLERTAPPLRLAARENGRIRMVDLRQVSWVAAERDYVRYHEPARSLLVRKTMAEAARELADSRFVRIHRSAIVNLDHVVEMWPVPGGDCRVLLRQGTLLTFSRTYRKKAGGIFRTSAPTSARTQQGALEGWDQVGL
jgi:two-component system LytT family response regulator